MKTLVLAIITSLLAGCSVSDSSKSQKFRISHDVYVENLSPNDSDQFSSFEKTPYSTCEQHLQKITCISETDQLGFDSKCSSKNVTPAMLESLNLVYLELPDFHKKVFCHLNRIQIHPKIYSIGYVSVIIGPDGDYSGGMMGLKIEMLEADNNNQSMSWKEQLNFGLTDLNDPKRQPTPQGPFVEEIVSSTRPKLFAVVVHEMNHLIDIFNDVNRSFDSCDPIEGQEFLARCQYTADSFPTLSWGDETQIFTDMPPEDYQFSYPAPIWVDKYPLLSRLCYYWCDGKVISPSLISQTYQQLYESPFLTGYSTSSEMEDFAESAMIWVLSQSDRPMNYVLTDGNKRVIYETDVHVQNKVVQAKLNWLKNFFNRNNLKYKF